MTDTKLRTLAQVKIDTGIHFSDPIRPHLFVENHEARLGAAVALTQFGVYALPLTPSPRGKGGKRSLTMAKIHPEEMTELREWAQGRAGGRSPGGARRSATRRASRAFGVGDFAAWRKPAGGLEATA